MTNKLFDSSESPRIIEFPKIEDPRGNLTFLQDLDCFEQAVKRCYWIYDVPGGETRGGHAFKKQNEVIIALSGSFTVVVFDGKSTEQYHLNRSYYGLYIPQGYWRHMENFSTNSLGLCVADTVFSPEDYVRDKEEYIRNRTHV